MDVVLVGLPGSGKSAVGRRLASDRGVAFVDLDDTIEQAAGVSIAAIFAAEGETGFRARERAAVEALGHAAADPGISRVIAAGGGAVVDPRNRWRLCRGRRAVWLDAPIAHLAARLGGEPATERPLFAEGDAATLLEQLLAARLPFYAACPRIDGDGDPATVAARVVDTLATMGLLDGGPGLDGTTLLRVTDPAGRVVLGDGMAATAIDAELRAADARRAIVLSEPGAWAAAGDGIAASLRGLGWPVEPVLLPAGEDAKRLAVVETVAGRLARLGLERDEPIVAIGGGALTDTAGFAAATYARGVPWIAVPTTLIGQVDAAIGGKTAVDLPEGKNLLGAFHRPTAVVIDVAVLATLPERHRRAALGEVVKTGALGDARLLELLETDGPALASGDPSASDSGVLAELVERAARYKLDIVGRDPEEHGERVSLNLGHSLGHAIEAASGFGDVLHGEAVAYGLRAACRLGVARGVLAGDRAARIEALLDALGLGVAPLPCPAEALLEVLAADKKRRHGRLRWVLPTDDGWALDDAIPDDLVAAVAASVLAGRLAAGSGGAPSERVSAGLAR